MSQTTQDTRPRSLPKPPSGERARLRFDQFLRRRRRGTPREPGRLWSNLKVAGQAGVLFVYLAAIGWLTWSTDFSRLDFKRLWRLYDFVAAAAGAPDYFTTMADYRIAPLHNDRAVLAERIARFCATTGPSAPALAAARERGCRAREEAYLAEDKQFFDFSRLNGVELVVLERHCSMRATTLRGYDTCIARALDVVSCAPDFGPCGAALIIPDLEPLPALRLMQECSVSRYPELDQTLFQFHQCLIQRRPAREI